MPKLTIDIKDSELWFMELVLDNHANRMSDSARTSFGEGKAISQVVEWQLHKALELKQQVANRRSKIEYEDMRHTVSVAFDKAIETNRLSRDESAANYVGNFMYMGTDAGHDLFKDSMTREYLK